MMESLFLHLVNMSITAGWLVLAVLVLRLVFRRAPKWIHCLLWVLVALRLIFPVSIESVVSLIPSAETVPVDTFLYETPSIHSGVPVVDNAVNPIISNNFAPEPMNSVNPMQVVSMVASYVWVLGMAAMALYALITTARLWWRVRESVTLRDNIRLCDRIATPFILGLFRPRIYLPTTLTDSDTACVLAHEQAHLRRRDHWWKPLGFLLLTVYWFNPLLWVGYILLCRDIEAACDEKVIRHMDVAQRKAYSETLLACSAPRHLITACPLAFGETGVKSRIKSVLNYKKPAFWIIIAAVVATVVAAVCLLTNPKVNDVPENLDAYLTQVILEQNRSEHTGDAFATEAHTVFGTEEKDGKTVVYGLVLYEEYLQDEAGNLEVQSGSHIPTVITVDMEGNGYSLVEYWIPRDGDLYAPDIRDKFPARYQGQAFDLNRYYDGHKEKTLAAARAHFALAELPDDSEYETYAYVGPPSAQLSLQREGNKATFTPHILSSWVAAGTYERNENQVIFTAEGMKLVFRVDGNSLIFDKTASTFDAQQITFGGIEMEDGAPFVRLENAKQTIPFVNHTKAIGWLGDDQEEEMFVDAPPDNQNRYLPIIAIDSAEEWIAFAEKYSLSVHSKNTYTEEYFADRALLAVYYSSGTCSYKPQIAQLLLQENGSVLTAMVDVYTPEMCDEGMGGWFLLAEVDRLSIRNVTKHYAMVRDLVPLYNYFVNFSHLLPAGNGGDPADRWVPYYLEVDRVRSIIKSAKWYSDTKAEKDARYLGYFSMDGETFYYIDLIGGRLFNGEKFADLTEAQVEIFEYLMRGGCPVNWTYASLTGTVETFNEEKNYLTLKVSQADQQELIGKTVKVYTYYYSGATLDKGTTITVGYDSWVEDNAVYGLTFENDKKAEDIVANDDDVISFVGKVLEVDYGMMRMDCYDKNDFDVVWVEYSESLPYFEPKVGNEYVVSGIYANREYHPSHFYARAITPVSSTPTASGGTITAPTFFVDDSGHEETAYLAAKVRVQRPADAGSTGGSVTGRIVRSVAELKAAKLDALTPYDGNETFTLDYYDEAYFKHNALVVSYVTLSSGSYYLSPIYLTRSNNRLVLHYQQIQHTTMMTGDMAYYCVLYEMYQQDVEGINSVIGNGTERKQDKLSLNPNYSISQARAILLSRLPKESSKLYVAYQATQSDFDDGNTYYCFQVYSLGAQPMELDGKQYYQQFTYAWAYVDVHTGKLYREDAAMNLIPWDKDQSTVTTKPTTTKPTTTKKTVTTTTTKKPTTTTKEPDADPTEPVDEMFTMDGILENMNRFSEEKEESLYKNVPKDENVRYLPVVVMTTQEELEGFIQEYGTEMGFSDDEAPLMRKDYNKAYFEKNVLLAVYYRDGSCSKEPRVVAMERTSDGTGLMALVDVYEPQIQNQLVGQWFMLCSVKRSDVEGVTSYTARVRGHVAENQYVAAFTKGVSDPKNAREKWRYFMDVELSWNMVQMINGFKWTDNKCDCLYFWTFNFSGKNYYLSEDYSILFDGTRYATLSAGDRAFFRKLFVPGDESIWVAPY